MGSPGQHAWRTERQRTGPLAGLKVIDLTTVVMGPFAAQILGDLGADVVKVESPTGDSVRGIGPWRNEGMGPLFLQNNRNKRSVVLDLKSPEDRANLLKLAGTADVFISNIRPAAMVRLGLTSDELTARNPRLIVCNAVGYGSGGRRSGQAVYDDLIQAAAGIAGLFGAVDGASRYAPTNIGDRTVALYVVIAVLAALRHREQTGQGQSVEVPMFETMAQFVLADHMGGAAFDPPLGPMGYRRLLSRHRGPYPTADGHLSLVVYTNDQWRRFLPLVGAEGLLEDDPRFASQESRTVHADEVGRWLAGHLTSRTTEEWLKLLAEVDIPASRVNTLETLLEDPHLNDVDFFVDYDHPSEGRLRTTRFPIEFSASPCDMPAPAPTRGAHRLADILNEPESGHAAQPSAAPFAPTTTTGE